MTFPEDLTIEIRGGRVYLRSAGRVVEFDFSGRDGMFRNGPLPWKFIEMAFLAPALSALQSPQAGA